MQKIRKFHRGVFYFTLNLMQHFLLHPDLNAAINADQDPVVQSIVSLTISLRHKFVKQISAKVTNTLLFFVEKM